jgi:uncharacterized protein YecA (UPF0149 family)
MNSSNKPTIPTDALHADVRRLLKKYHCPLQLHQVRAQFMGAIASPIDQINPAQEIQTIWGAQAPDFTSLTAANEFMQVLVMGLWNQQSAHFGTRHTFALAEHIPEPTEKGLKAHAQLRFEELQSFLLGYLQGQDSLDLSTEVCDCLDILDDLIAMFGGIAHLPKERRATTQRELGGLIDQVDELAKIAQREVNQIIAASAQQRQGDGSAPTRLH